MNTEQEEIIFYEVNALQVAVMQLHKGTRISRLTTTQLVKGKMIQLSLVECSCLDMFWVLIQRVIKDNVIWT